MLTRDSCAQRQQCTCLSCSSSPSFFIVGAVIQFQLVAAEYKHGGSFPTSSWRLTLSRSAHFALAHDLSSSSPATRCRLGALPAILPFPKASAAAPMSAPHRFEYEDDDPPPPPPPHPAAATAREAIADVLSPPAAFFRPFAFVFMPPDEKVDAALFFSSFCLCFLNASSTALVVSSVSVSASFLPHFCL